MPSDHRLHVSFTGQHKRLISSPPVAVFPHPLASDLSFSRYCKFAWERYASYLCSCSVKEVNYISPIYCVIKNKVFMWEASLGKLEMGAKRTYNIIIFVHRTIGKPNTAYFLSKNTRWIIGYVHGSMKISK